MERRIEYFTNNLINKLILESEFQMNSLSIQIPFNYALELVNINWSDILFGINNGYFNINSAIEYAVILLGKDEENEKILDLACVNPPEITTEELLQEYLIELAYTVSNKGKEETEDKIMYVLLKFLFDNKKIFEDPFMVIELIYDDFKAPKIIEDFVLYMPSKRLVLTTYEQNIERMYNDWEKYLCSQKLRFMPNI